VPVRRKFAIFSKIYWRKNRYIMNKIANYFKESYLELQEKVTWPTWANLQQSTVIVLVATVIITALVWVMDFSGSQLLKLIYSLLK